MSSSKTNQTGIGIVTATNRRVVDEENRIDTIGADDAVSAELVQQDGDLVEPLLPTATIVATATTPSRTGTAKNDFCCSDAGCADGKCMFDACFCFYDGCDCKDMEWGCQAKRECLCLKHGFCLSFSTENFGLGITTDDGEGSVEICKIGLFCCDLALVKPSTCCSGATTFLCCYAVSSLPFDPEYLDTCVCAYCGVSCAPRCGCCVPPPDCPAIRKIRGDGDGDVIAAEEMDRG